jgi:hypothetical protein
VAIFGYTARRSLTPSHVLNERQSIELELSDAVSFTESDVKSAERSPGGGLEVGFERTDVLWSLSFAPVRGAQVDALREFLDSTESGEAFSMWLRSGESSPIVLKRTEDSHALQPFMRVGARRGDWWTASFEAIEVAAFDDTSETFDPYAPSAGGDTSSGGGFDPVPAGAPVGSGVYVLGSHPLLLMHFDGVDGSQTLTDSSEWNRAVTLEGADDATLSASSPKFGDTALNIGPNTHLSVPYGTEMGLASGNFTVEMWFRTTSLEVVTLFDAIFIGDSRYPVQITAAGGTINANGADATGTTKYSASVTSFGLFDGNWHHVALVRNGPSFVLYTDGVGQANSLAAYGGTLGQLIAPWTIASPSSSSPAVHIDEVRVMASAVYTANFTPAGPFSALDGNLITWSAATPGGYALASYVIERRVGALADWTIIKTQSAASDRAYIDTALTAGVTYSYRVRAIDTGGGDGLPSNEFSLTTPIAVAPRTPWRRYQPQAIAAPFPHRSHLVRRR